MAKTTITAQLYKQNKTHQWLADRLNVTLGAVAKWMRGTRPSNYSTMRHVADLLLCEPGDLWDGIKQTINWEHRYKVITDRMLELDPRQDREEFLRLCSERAAASVHIYVAESRKATSTTSYGYDEYTTPSVMWQRW
ncbi:MAG: hypothetical protein IJ894_10705 [Bacteroidales bacterium]|nr:hypothetical protein [Bacteroidales bacterium]MBR3712286.1 hypothetical protein [Bacteroidales bacterium]MBR4273823.1 hypothetical protein [Bacteroidales bacterium]